LEQVSEQFIGQKTMTRHSLEALPQHSLVSPLAEQPLRQALSRLEEQIQALETEVVGLLEQPYARQMPLLCSLPGIGRKTAALLLLVAKGFTQGANYGQLIAKAGLCPRAYSSGTRVRGKSRLTRMGGGVIRSKLFRGSFSAKKANVACKALYDRLVAKGKKGKLASIAVCKKLLQQAGAIVKSGIPYQPDFAKIST
jgi:transposase